MKNSMKLLSVFLVMASVSVAQDMAQTSISGNGFYRFDAQPTWLHGFHRSRSPFSGHASFRPSNYQQALARAEYTRTYPNHFLGQNRQPTSLDRYRMHRATALQPTTPVRLGRTGRAVSNGGMSPIQSLRVAKPVSVPEQAVEPPRVIRAIQREETGPLFPLPPLP